MNKKLLTIQQAAEYFGCTHWTLRRWVQNKQIRHTRTPSGALRFKQEWLDEITAENERKRIRR